jgi:hypothetical protein
MHFNSFSDAQIFVVTVSIFFFGLALCLCLFYIIPTIIQCIRYRPQVKPIIEDDNKKNKKNNELTINPMQIGIGV